MEHRNEVTNIDIYPLNSMGSYFCANSR